MNSITLLDLQEKKQRGEKIVMLTAYDEPMARMIDEAGIDIVLVGDSVGMVILGYNSTVSVTIEEMIHHTKAVRRGIKRAFLIGDLPFMSYQASTEEAIRNAGRFMKEAGCDAVKLEGGEEMADKVESIVRAGIPVLGHIGLTPQTISKLSGYRIQGRNFASAKKLLRDAATLEEAGAFGIVLECIPHQLAKIITERTSFITIGIGAGPCCDGQVLVIHDLLGLFEKFVPKFVKVYVHLAPQIKEAITQFKQEVESGIFPNTEHAFSMEEEELKRLLNNLA